MQRFLQKAVTPVYPVLEGTQAQPYKLLPLLKGHYQRPHQACEHHQQVRQASRNAEDELNEHVASLTSVRTLQHGPAVTPLSASHACTLQTQLFALPPVLLLVLLLTAAVLTFSCIACATVVYYQLQWMSNMC